MLKLAVNEKCKQFLNGAFNSFRCKVSMQKHSTWNQWLWMKKKCKQPGKACVPLVNLFTLNVNSFSTEPNQGPEHIFGEPTEAWRVGMWATRKQYFVAVWKTKFIAHECEYEILQHFLFQNAINLIQLKRFSAHAKTCRKYFISQHANVPSHEKAIKLTTMKILKVSE